MKKFGFIDRIKVAIGERKIVDFLVSMNRDQWRSFKRSYIEAERMRYRNGQNV